MLSPVSSIVWAECTIRSRMASVPYLAYYYYKKDDLHSSLTYLKQAA